MTVRVFCRISDPFGVPLIDVTQFSVLDYILNCAPGAIGVLELTVVPAIDPTLLFPDGRIEVYRSIDGNPPYSDNNAVFLMETFQYSKLSTFIRAFHVNTLTTRRYVTYASGSSFSNKTATFADDLLKTYWKENAGSSIGAAREGTQTQADLSSYISVQPNLSLGPNVSMVGAHDPLDGVLARICDASSTAGTYLTYEIVSLGDRTFEFRTYTTSRGGDHSTSSPFPVTLSESRGNLVNSVLTVDYHNEITAAIALGQGQLDEATVQSSLDTVRMGISPFHRIERIFDAANVSTTATCLDIADAGVRSARPVISMSGNLINTAVCTRGIHYDLGDILVAESNYGQTQFDVRLDLIHEHFDAKGSQSGQDLTAHQVAHRYTIGGLRSV